MGLYVDELAVDIQREANDNNATRADYERALDIVFGSDTSPHVDALAFKDAVKELDEAHADLRSEAYPYPSQRKRVSDAELALYKIVGVE